MKPVGQQTVELSPKGTRWVCDTCGQTGRDKQVMIRKGCSQCYKAKPIKVDTKDYL